LRHWPALQLCPYRDVFSFVKIFPTLRKYFQLSENISNFLKIFPTS